MKNLTSKHLFTLTQRYRTEIRRAINAKALNINAMHIQCLRFIAQTTNCTANCIGQGLARDKSQISIVIKDMVNKGWIKKVENSADKRSQLLVLTTTGQELVDKVQHAEAAINKRMQQGLSEQELATFEATITTMIENLQ